MEMNVRLSKRHSLRIAVRVPLPSARASSRLRSGVGQVRDVMWTKEADASGASGAQTITGTVEEAVERAAAPSPGRKD
jgi:hypothetical protein